MTTRPVGHITAQIKDLQRWRVNRILHGLEVKTLDLTITYLKEYREAVLYIKELRRTT